MTSTGPPRLSQVLPIVQCVDCGQEVEYGKLTAHGCVAAPEVPPIPASPTPSSDMSFPDGEIIFETYSSGRSSRASRATVTSLLPSLATANTAPLSPMRTVSVMGRPRPALPYLEKYSKRKAASAPALLYRHSQQHTISPIIAAALSYSLDPPHQLPGQQDPSSNPPTRRGLSTQQTIDETMEETMDDIVCSYPIRQKPTRLPPPSRPVPPAPVPAIPRKSSARRTSGTAPRATGNPADLNRGDGKDQGVTSDSRTEQDQNQDPRKPHRPLPVPVPIPVLSPPIASSGSLSAPNDMVRTSSSGSIETSSQSQQVNDLQNERSGSIISEGSDHAAGLEDHGDMDDSIESDSSDYPYDLIPDNQSVKSPLHKESFQMHSPRSSMAEDPNSWDIISEYNKASPSLSPVEESEHDDTDSELTPTTHRPITPAESMSSTSPVPHKDSTVITGDDADQSTTLPTESVQTKPKSKGGFRSMMEDLLHDLKSIPKRNRAAVAEEESKSQESATTVSPPAPLRIKGARQSVDVHKTTVVSPIQPRGTNSLLPPPKAQPPTQDGQRTPSPKPDEPTDRSTPSPTPGQDKGLSHADDIRRSPTHKPVMVPITLSSEEGPRSRSPSATQTRTTQRGENKNSPTPASVILPGDGSRSRSPTSAQPRTAQRGENKNSPTPAAVILPGDGRRPKSPSSTQTRTTQPRENKNNPAPPASPFCLETVADLRLHLQHKHGLLSEVRLRIALHHPQV
ncbi:MAG: hypothetical protein J3Q66DRAFT_116656 [Benniella sp.]|nr:MAG: hypothetical protein J3Q66DRAFT_116656 [Benniella sp.]